MPQSLWLRACETTVRCFRDHELVAVHPRLHQPGRRSTVDEHLPPEALAYKMQTPQWCLNQAQEIGPGCHELIETLFAHRGLDNLRAAQGVIGLRKKYGNNRLDAACLRALAHDSALYRTVKTILDKEAVNKSNMALSQQQQDNGGPMTTVWGAPIKFLESLLDSTEATVA